MKIIILNDYYSVLVVALQIAVNSTRGLLDASCNVGSIEFNLLRRKKYI